MNSKINILVTPVDLKKSLSEVGEMIEQVKKINVPKYYSQLNAQIQAIQLIDVNSYKIHFDNFMSTQEPVVPLGSFLDIKTLEKLKSDITNYVGQLAAVHRIMKVLRSNQQLPHVIRKAYDTHSQAHADFHQMRTFNEKATEILEKICRHHKDAFTTDSQEAQYSRYLLTMTGNMGRMENELNLYAQSLDDVTQKISLTLEKLNQDFKKLNFRIKGLVHIADVFNIACGRKLKQLQTKRNLFFIVGTLSLIALFAALHHQLAHALYIIVPVLLSFFYSFMNHYKSETYKKFMNRALIAVKTLSKNTIKMVD